MILFKTHIITTQDTIWICANIIYLGNTSTIEMNVKCSCGETHELDYDLDSYYGVAKHIPTVNITPNYGRSNETN